MLKYLYSYKHYNQYLLLKKEISIQICKLDNVVNSLEEMLPGYADPDAGYSDAAIKLIWQVMLILMLILMLVILMLILMLVILMLILMLLNLITCYANTVADLCIRIMSLRCILNVCLFNVRKNYITNIIQSLWKLNIWVMHRLKFNSLSSEIVTSQI